MTAQAEPEIRPASWDVRFGGMHGTSPVTGNTYDGLPSILVVEPTAAPAAEIAGRAADLDLWLWGRRSMAGLEVTGDRAVADRLRDLCAQEMN